MESTGEKKILEKKLEEARRTLLDLTANNRLINMRLNSKTAKLIQTKGANSKLVYERLLTNKVISFLPNPEETLFAIEEKTFSSEKLQTNLTEERLEKVLSGFYNDYNSAIEETGVNILYLAIGSLTWYEKDQKELRTSPLLLVPVELIKKTKNERFTIKYSGEEINGNLSLSEKLKTDHKISISQFESDNEGESELTKYFELLTKEVSSKKYWAIDKDFTCLGFFEFAKLLMYKDLESATWPNNTLTANELIKKFLIGNDQSAFDPESVSEKRISELLNNQKLDDIIPTERLEHVVDADSSQTRAIELARENINLVIQGPPGTGKSQTITNIISTAVLDGKKVLFLAEKAAALEVVYRRLEKEGLSDICLSLHSRKATKTEVIRNIKKTWELGELKNQVNEGDISELAKIRTILNDHAEKLNLTDSVVKYTAFDAIGTLENIGRGIPQEHKIEINKITEWTLEQFNNAISNLTILSGNYNVISNPINHVWTSARIVSYSEINESSTSTLLTELCSTIENLLSYVKEINNHLGLPLLDTLTYNQAERLDKILDLISLKPSIEVKTLNNPVWKTSIIKIKAIAERKQRLDAIKAGLKNTVNEEVYDIDSKLQFKIIKENGGKMLSFMNSEYNKNIKYFKKYLIDHSKQNHEQRVHLLDKILEGQKINQEISAENELIKNAFGDNEMESGSKLLELIDWVEKLNLLEKNSLSTQQYFDLKNANKFKGKVQAILVKFNVDLEEVNKSLIIDWDNELAGKEIKSIELRTILAKIQNWVNNLNNLSSWVNYYNSRTKCNEDGLGPITVYVEKNNGLYSNKTTDELEVDFVDVLKRVRARATLKLLFNLHPELGTFDGIAHDQKIRTFRKLDSNMKDIAKIKVLQKHYNQKPSASFGIGGLLKGELEKLRKIKPIRKLFAETTEPIQLIKPVFMMSPLSVAQFLAPGKIEFDLLIIDEASQIPPIEALGAIARCKQIIVVGDDKQLPPSSFFAKLTSNVDDDDDKDEDEVIDGTVTQVEHADFKDMESILSACKARGIRETTLRWHYRSQHQTLIAVSNKEYYESRLFIVPSPIDNATSTVGLYFNAVEGIYDRGASRTNEIEAKEVAKAVIYHATNNGDKTLMVATFSAAQQEHIRNEIEVLKKNNPASESFFNSHPNEPFSIKNLENIQGDERDVIFISVGYGKDKNGKLSMNFGPLSSTGGERRLNVLITRAKTSCHVFSSISDNDLDIADNTSRGVHGLKVFLKYARSKQLDLHEQSNREMGSEFEVGVKRRIENELGYKVGTQIGTAGFFIDLAIQDPKNPGRFILGIECDGVSYHISQSARERDRLRQTILENQGWKIHRLWSIDFFKDPKREIEKIKKAIESAIASQKSDLKSTKPQEVIPKITSFIRNTEVALEPTFTISYVTATFLAIKEDPYEMRKSKIADMIKEIILIESPIHFDEVITRMREVFSFGRAGDRFRDLIRESYNQNKSENLNEISFTNNFFVVKGKEIKARDRSNLKPKAEYIHESEVDMLIIGITKASLGIGSDELIREVNEGFGFKKLGQEMTTKISLRIDHLKKVKTIVEVDGNLKVAE